MAQSRYIAVLDFAWAATAFARDSLADAIASERFRRLDDEIGRGVEMCRKDCSYFALCGGGPPGNKYFENGTFASTETLFCRLHKKACFDVTLGRLEKADIDVYVLYGNHDAESVLTKKLPLPGNVHVLPVDAAGTVVFEALGLAVHGQGYATAAVTEDLSAGYPRARSGMVNVGLLHTSADGRFDHAPYAPCRVDRLAAVENCRNACSVTAAFASREYDKLRGAFVDHLHQPFRKKLIPFLDNVIAAAESAGALGAFLSGSGSTICAVTLRSPEKVSRAMLAAANSDDARTIVTSADNRGARLLTIANRKSQIGNSPNGSSR